MNSCTHETQQPQIKDRKKKNYFIAAIRCKKKDLFVHIEIAGKRQEGRGEHLNLCPYGDWRGTLYTPFFLQNWNEYKCFD